MEIEWTAEHFEHTRLVLPQWAVEPVLPDEWEPTHIPMYWGLMHADPIMPPRIYVGHIVRIV